MSNTSEGSALGTREHAKAMVLDRERERSSRWAALVSTVGSMRGWNFVRCGDPVVVASAGRSGTHLLIDVLRYQFADFTSYKLPGESVAALFVTLENVASRRCPRNIAQLRLRRPRRPILLAHEWPATLSELDRTDPDLATWLRARGRVVLIVRDPRVAIGKLWPLTAHIERWEPGSVNADAFVRDRARRWAAQIEAIKDDERAMVVRLEDMLAEPKAEIVRIGRFLSAEPRLRAPLLIRPNSDRVDTRLGRLLVRPRSTHVVLPEVLRTRFRLDWTPARLAILDRYAGESMESVGYERPLSVPEGIPLWADAAVLGAGCLIPDGREERRPRAG